MAKRASIPEIGTAPPVPPVPPVPPAPEDEAGADAKLAGEVIDETGLKALFDQKIAEMNERIAQMSKVPAGDFVTRQEVAGFITADHVRQMIEEKLAQLRREAAPDYSKMDNLPRIV